MRRAQGLATQRVLLTAHSRLLKKAQESIDLRLKSRTRRPLASAMIRAPRENVTAARQSPAERQRVWSTQRYCR